MRLTPVHRVWIAAVGCVVGTAVQYLGEAAGIDALGPLLILGSILLMFQASWSARREAGGPRFFPPRGGALLAIGAIFAVFMAAQYDAFGPEASPMVQQMAMLVLLVAISLEQVQREG